MRTVYFILLLVSIANASLSTDLTISSNVTGYNIQWETPTSPVTLVRGDFNDTYMMFTETTVYTGMDAQYTDTLGTIDTKYYRLEFSGGSTKKDINKEGMYDLVIDNMATINHDNDSLIAEARYAQFGAGGILMWKSITEGFKIVSDYSGTNQTFINISDVDNDLHRNYYIIDNINNLTSVTVYKLHADLSTTKLFKLNFGQTTNPQTQTNVLQLVAGTTHNVNINNGSITNFNDKIQTTNNNNGIFAEGSGSGAGGGGGCFLSK